MANELDDLFKNAEDESARRRSEKDQQAHDAEVYDRGVLPLVQRLVDAAKTKAERFRDHEKNTNKPAVIGGGTQLVVRRVSDIVNDVRIPERRLEITFRQDRGELSWRYEMVPTIHSEPEIVDQGTAGFRVSGEKVLFDGAHTPEEFAEMVLDEYIADCIRDYGKV